MPSTTIYASSGSGQVGSYALTSGGSTSWDNARALTSNAWADSTSASRYLTNSAAGAWWASRDYVVTRFLLPFDLSGISGTITAATLGIYVTSRDASTFAQNIYVVSTSQASLTALTVADGQSVGSTSLCDTQPLVSGITLNAYQTFALNASGLAACTPGGAAKLALRMSADFSNVAPVPSGFGTTGEESVIYANLDNAASNKPYLDITYSLPAGSTHRRRRPSGLYVR